MKAYKVFNSDWSCISLKFSLTSFIGYDLMTEKEKKEYPEYKTIGGYLKVNDYKTACKIWWWKLTEEEKKIFQTIPNFDKKIFKEITGIKI